MNYELIMADECFDDDNNGLIYGIHWLNEDCTTVVDCEWFKTEKERQNVLDKAWADYYDWLYLDC